MRLTVAVLLMLALCIHAELHLKPRASTLKKNVGESLVLTCEWEEEEEEEEEDLSIEEEEEEDVGGADDDGGSVIKWYDNKNMEVVSRNSSTKKFVETDNGHTQKLFLNEISTSDGGRYRCERLSKTGTTTKSLQLLILQDITFGDTASVQHPLQGHDVIINCSVFSHPSAMVSWIHKKKKIGTSKKTNKYEKKGQNLLIRDVKEEDGGVYLCRAEVAEEAMFDEKEIVVDVYVPPSITRGLRERQGMEGDQLTMSCEASGNPPPSITFVKNGEVVEESERMGVEERRVVIGGLREEDGGDWLCKASSAAGEDISKGGIVVLVKPSIEHFSNVSVTELQPSHLDCSLRGYPPPSVSFLRSSDGAIFEEGDYEDGLVSAYSNGRNHKRLTIKITSSTHAGVYVCRGVSELGETQASASLTVSYKPKISSEQQRTINIWAGKQRNISCEVNAVPPPKIKWTSLGKTIVKEGGYEVFDVADGKSELQLSATSANLKHLLTPVTCHASNQYGNASVVVQVKQATHPSPPASINVSESYSTGILLSITPPLSDGGEEVKKYVVEAEHGKQKKDDGAFNVSIADGKSSYPPSYTIHTASLLQIDDTHLRVLYLQPDTIYLIKVRAVNEVGQSNPVSIVASTLPTREPYPVTLETREDSFYWRFLVKWEELKSGGKRVEEVQMKYRKKTDANSQKTGSWKTVSQSLDPNINIDHILLDDLDANSAYQVQARARNEIGWSEYGPISSFQTRKATPHEESVRYSKSSLHIGIIIIIIILLLVVFIVIIDLCCYRFLGCGLSRLVVSRMNGGRCSEKERVVEEGEKECLKQEEEVNKVPVVLTTVEESAQQASKELVA